PSILIETVSAGGGSIARLDEGGALKVGPDSAGAVPGPACYGRGGTRPTVTDACLVLAWLDAATPLADESRLDPGASERAVAARVDVLASYHRELDGLQPTDIGRAFSPLLRNGSEQLPGAALWRYVDCRFFGQGYELTIPVATNNPRQIRDAFLAAHRERLGHEGVGQAVELVNLRVVAVREAPLPQLAGNAVTKRTTAKSRGRRAVVLGRGTKR